MTLKQTICLALLLACAPLATAAASKPFAVAAADSALTRWPDAQVTPKGATWNYELGTLLAGLDAVWLDTADARYYRYIKAAVDPFVADDGSIRTLNENEHQLDNILLGRQLLLLYGVTREPKYARAAQRFYAQLQQQPRTAEGGFWHKQRYPEQMWLDGLYMAEPFYAEYAVTFQQTDKLADVLHQFQLADQHTRDSRTGLAWHGWDASHHERWADPQTGHSPEFWARAMGWRMMALVDVLDQLPLSDKGRAELLRELAADAAAIRRVQTPGGAWLDVLNKPHARGNYEESSATCMFVYALSKGVRRGYLPAEYRSVAERGWSAVQAKFIERSGDAITLKATVKASGLGGDPYRDGSLNYYLSEPVAQNDPKGVGALLLAAVEMEHIAAPEHGKTVLMDAWFNSQSRTDAFGNRALFHYKWDDLSNSGFSVLGNAVQQLGAATATLTTAPTVEVLKGASVYVIVSPDIPVKNPNPHYMSEANAAAIEQWVRAGGVLAIFENDPANADIEHVNLLSERFGIHFNPVLRNTVDGNHFEQARVDIQPNQIFRQPHVAYLKEICTITPSGDAKSLLVDRGDTLMAVAHVGKGTVFAVVDPWLYNEYVDGRKLPVPFDNLEAGRELMRWLLEQAK